MKDPGKNSMSLKHGINIYTVVTRSMYDMLDTQCEVNRKEST
jgi:hypothetical protein